jgi:hypothetical protein
MWFPPGTPVTSTNKADCHYVTEILLKVTLSTITLTLHIVGFGNKPIMAYTNPCPWTLMFLFNDNENLDQIKVIVPL